jgi:outer membrane immunogenic protein
MLEFHKLTIAGALLAGAVGVASAADMRAPAPPPPPPISFYNWTGFYLGIQGGGGFGELERTPVTTGTASRDPTGGGLVGGTVGVNWQTGAWVFGFEADYAWADIKSRSDCFVNGLVCSSALESFGTARLRIGGAWDRMLIYGTGGFAFGDQTLQVANPTIPGVSV